MGVQGKMVGRCVATAVALLLVLVTGTEAAQATTDGGRQARVLAFAGAGERYAIVAEESLQEPCHLHRCVVYSLDLREGVFAPLWRKPVNGKEPLTAYLEQLARQRRVLEPVRGLNESNAVHFSIGEGGSTTLQDAGSDGVPIGLSLAVVDRLPSMSAYEHTTDEYCATPADPPRCSSCKLVPYQLNGAPHPSIACSGAGQWHVNGVSKPCDCSGKADLVELRISAEGRSGRGSQALIAPYLLGQNVMGGRHAAETNTLVMPHHGTGYWSGGGALIVALGVAHAPMANGTYFPMVAVLPAANPAAAAPTATASATPQATVIALPSPPPEPTPGGCAGCSIGRGASDAASWLLVAAALALRTRRRGIAAE